jgi:hypothetical protein
MNDPDAPTASIVEAMANPLSVLDGKMRVVTARGSFYLSATASHAGAYQELGARSVRFLARQEHYVNGGRALILAHHTITQHRTLERRLPTVLFKKEKDCRGQYWTVSRLFCG